MRWGTYSSLLQVFSSARLLSSTPHHRTLQPLPQHDVAFDYYGQRMATASSDRTVKVFDVSTEQQTLVAELRNYDRRVILHKENGPGAWAPVYAHEAHKSSVNSVAWAPYELGLALACGSSDGTLSVLTHTAGGEWAVQTLHDAPTGVNAVSWAPAHHLGAQVVPSTPGSAVAHSGPQVVRRLASAGCDGMVRVWRADMSGVWSVEAKLAGSAGWARDVAWAPAAGSPVNVIAAAYEEKKVIIWRQTAPEGEWQRVDLPVFPAAVWRVSWSLTGALLAVSCGDNSVTLWAEGNDGQWRQTSEVRDE